MPLDTVRVSEVVEVRPVASAAVMVREMAVPTMMAAIWVVLATDSRPSWEGWTANRVRAAARVSPALGPVEDAPVMSYVIWQKQSHASGR